MEKEQFDKDLRDIQKYFDENYKDYHLLFLISHKKNDNDLYYFGGDLYGDKNVVSSGICEILNADNSISKIIFNSFMIWAGKLSNKSREYLKKSIDNTNTLLNE